MTATRIDLLPTFIEALTAVQCILLIVGMDLVTGKWPLSGPQAEYAVMIAVTVRQGNAFRPTHRTTAR